MIDLKEHIKEYFETTVDEAIKYESEVNAAVNEVLTAEDSDIPLSAALLNEAAFPQLYYFHRNIMVPVSVSTSDTFVIGWELDLTDELKEFLRAMALEAISEESSKEWRAFLRLALFEIAFCAEVGERYDLGDDGVGILEASEARADALLYVARIQVEKERVPPTRSFIEVFEQVINNAKIADISTYPEWGQA